MTDGRGSIGANGLAGGSPPTARPDTMLVSRGYPLSALHRGVILFLVGFLLVFPKGGVKIAGVPLTWGYLGLAPLFAVLALSMLSGRRGAIPLSRLIVLAALLPFQALILYALSVQGVRDVGFTISLLVTFFFVPLMFVLVLGEYIDRIDLRFPLRLIRIALPLVAAYGIFLFFYKLKTGSFLEIPYLTVNAGDVGALETKHIDRGGVFKLISTYNNGNLYGISLMMLMPLYGWMERRRLPNWVVKLSLLLTLSRTVWAGLLFSELLQRLYVRRMSFRAVAVTGASLAVLGAAILFATDVLLERDVSRFLFDRSLGGRQSNWEHLDRATLLPGMPFETILEMIYLSVLQSFGVLGLATFLAGMVCPLGLFFAGALPLSATPYKRSIAAGLMVWLFMALGDGAILYIPVGVIYWFLVSLLLSDNRSMLPEDESDAESEHPIPPSNAVRLVPSRARA